VNNKIIPLRSEDRNAAQASKADRSLARLAADGDREAFRQIVDANKQRMFTVAKSVIRDSGLAEDIVQDAFIKAYRALPDFRGDSRLSTWLHRITYLTAIDHRRREARHLELVEDGDLTEAVADSSPFARSDGSVHSGQLAGQINAAIGQLSEFEQIVFTLRHLQNFRLKEIAVVLDRSEGTIKNILFRAIRKLRESLSDSQLDGLEA
jgi:RNA polymerase sigma-70 factor (ECF subfamily)